MKRDSFRILCLVPAFNEEETIARTVRALLEIDSIESVTVLDDHSFDRTPLEAVKAGARLISNGKNLGKGGSINRVLPHFDFDFLLLVDGDLGERATEARLILEAVLKGEADLAIASFPPALRKGGFGLVKGLARLGIKMLTGKEFLSPISGQRAMNRRAFNATFPFDGGFGIEVGMTVDALNSGLRVVEIPTTMSHRETGRDIAGFMHRGKQFRDIFKALMKRLIGGR